MSHYNNLLFTTIFSLFLLILITNYCKSTDYNFFMLDLPGSSPNIDIEEGWLNIKHKNRKDRFLFPRQARQGRAT